MSASDETIQKSVADKKKEIGEEEFSRNLRRLMLQAGDTFWIEHLEIMDYMRGSVNLRAYGQRDPLVEYKKEGLRLFREMETATAEQIVRLIPAIGGAPTISVGATSREESRRLVEVHEQAQIIGSGDAQSNRVHHGKPHEKTLDGQKVRRNDLCPCGSGKKYKRCHGA